MPRPQRLQKQNAVVPSAAPFALAPVAPSPSAPAMQLVSARPSSVSRTSHLAHDARNWLTVLRIHCDLLEQSGAVAKEHRAWLQELSAAIDCGQNLVSSLLAAASASLVPVDFPAGKIAISSVESNPKTSVAEPDGIPGCIAEPALPVASCGRSACRTSEQPQTPCAAPPSQPHPERPLHLLERKPRTMLSTSTTTLSMPVNSLPSPADP